MDRRAFAVTATPLHLVVTFEDGNVRFLSRKGLNVELPTAPKVVEIGGVELVWVNETALGATSRADFVAKLRALLAKTGRSQGWVWQNQVFPQRRITAETTAASSTVYKPMSANGSAAVWFSTPTSAYVDSFNANDDAAGSGLQSVRIIGLDADFAEVSEVVDLVGSTSSSSTTQTFRRINSAEPVGVGSDFGGNVNSVYVTSTGPSRHVWLGDKFTSSSYGVGQGSTYKYTVPAGYTAYATGLDISSYSGADSVDAFLWSHSNDAASGPAVLELRLVGEYPDNVSKPFAAPLKFPAKTDLWLTGRCAGTDSSAQLHLFLVPN